MDVIKWKKSYLTYSNTNFDGGMKNVVIGRV
jgi:hypothetical protein